MGFSGGSDSKESACNAGDLGSIPGFRRTPGEGNGYPLQYSCLTAEFHGERSLSGYSAWDGKESDMTEQLTQQLDKSAKKPKTSSFCYHSRGTCSLKNNRKHSAFKTTDGKLLEKQ